MQFRVVISFLPKPWDKLREYRTRLYDFFDERKKKEEAEVMKKMVEVVTMKRRLWGWWWLWRRLAVYTVFI